MKARLFGLVLPAFALIGCAVSPTPTQSSGTSGQPSNWMAQWTTSTPPLSVALTGDLQSSGSQVTGTFSISGVPCIQSSVETFTGALDANGNLNLSAPAVALQLQDFTSSGTTFNGTLGGGGWLCLAMIAPNPILATEIAPLNGTYTGALTASTGGDSGQATLTLTQSATPNADGSFSLGGTITFPSSTGFGTQPVSGRISGEGITLYDPTPGIVPVVSLTASTNPAGTEITVSNLAFAVTASDIVTFTGTLALQ